MSTLSTIFGDRRSGARPDFLPPGIFCAVIVLSVVILGTLLVVLWTSFLDGPLDEAATSTTLGNYLEIVEDGHTWSVILNTLAFSTISTIVALTFGVPAAWLAERTDLPGKMALFILMTIGLVIPGFATAMGWLFLMHPRIGILNTFLIRVFEFEEAPFNIISLVGMGWVQGLNLAPLAFIMTAAVFRAMDPSLEEAAHMSGARPRTTFASVTARLAWPGILAASIYIFTIGFAAFDVPAIIGWGNRIFTFATYLYLLTNPQDVLPRYGTAAALSTFILLLAALFAWWYSRMQRRAREYAVVTGKAYQPRTIPLGRNTVWAWCFILFYLLVSKLVPIILLVWSSVLPFFQLPSARAFQSMNLDHYYNLPWEQLYDGMINTGILMVLTPTVTLFFSLCFSWVVLRSRMPGRLAFDFIAFLPHAVPNIIFGVGALLISLYIIQAVVPIYGTIWILLLVFVIARVSYGTRMTNSGLIQIHQELEESAEVSGARTLGVARSVILPLLRPTLIYAWLWIALLTFRELTLAVILSTPSNITLPFIIWLQWESGGMALSSAIAVVMLLIMSVFVTIYWVVAGRRGYLSA
jgi:iron(III) transport system permease protein